ncbi:hypothetical protein ACO0QE_001324 [Hanseniaspora vineae]
MRNPLGYLFPIAKFSELKIEPQGSLNYQSQTVAQKQHQQSVDSAWVHHSCDSSTNTSLYFQLDYSNLNDFSSYFLTVIKIKDNDANCAETMLKIKVSELVTGTKNDAYKLGSMNVSQNIRFNVKFPIVGCKYTKAGVLNRFQINFLQKSHFEDAVNLFSKAGANIKDIGLLQTQQFSQFSQVLTDFPINNNNNNNNIIINKNKSFIQAQTQKQQTDSFNAEQQKVGNVQTNTSNQNEVSSISEISYGFQPFQATHYSTLPHQPLAPPLKEQPKNVWQESQASFQNMKKKNFAPINRTLQNVNSIDKFPLDEQKMNGQVPTPNQTNAFYTLENNIACQESPENNSLNLDKMIQSNVKEKIDQYIKSYFEQGSPRTEHRINDTQQKNYSFNKPSYVENTNRSLQYQDYQRLSNGDNMILPETQLQGFHPNFQNSFIQTNEKTVQRSDQISKKQRKKTKTKQKANRKTFKKFKKLDLNSQVSQFNLLANEKQVKIINKLAMKKTHELFDELSPNSQAAVFEKCSQMTQFYLRKNMTERKLFALDLERQLKHLKASMSKNPVNPLLKDIELKYGINAQYISSKINEKEFVNKVAKLNDFLKHLAESNEKQEKNQ